jgi:hypothetical protein
LAFWLRWVSLPTFVCVTRLPSSQPSCACQARRRRNLERQLQAQQYQQHIPPPPPSVDYGGYYASYYPSYPLAYPYVVLTGRLLGAGTALFRRGLHRPALRRSIMAA